MIRSKYDFENLVEIIDTKISWIKIRSCGDDGDLYLSYELLVFDPYSTELKISRHSDDSMNILDKFYCRTPTFEYLNPKQHYKFLQEFQIETTAETIKNEFYDQLDEFRGTHIECTSYVTMADKISEYWLYKIQKRVNKIIYEFTNLEFLSKEFKDKYKNCIVDNDDKILFSYWVPKTKNENRSYNSWNMKLINEQIMISNINEFMNNIPKDCEKIFVPISFEKAYLIKCE